MAGIFISCFPIFSPNMSGISGASNKLYQLRKIRGCITTKCALSIYKAMVLPIFEYGGIYLSSCTETEQTKLQRLQNQALRIIYKRDNYSNVYDLHNTARILPLKMRREMALLKIMFNRVHINQGLQVRQLTTRSHDGPIMEVPKPYSSKYIKSVAYRGPVLWNQVKPELRCLVSKQGFASALKSHYWELYKAHHHAH